MLREHPTTPKLEDNAGIARLLEVAKEREARGGDGQAVKKGQVK